MNRDRSSLPVPTPQQAAQKPRDSLDGNETIFAVGEDGDRFSEDDFDGSEERRGLNSSGRKND